MLERYGNANSKLLFSVCVCVCVCACVCVCVCVRVGQNRIYFALQHVRQISPIGDRSGNIMIEFLTENHRDARSAAHITVPKRATIISFFSPNFWKSNQTKQSMIRHERDPHRRSDRVLTLLMKCAVAKSYRLRKIKTLLNASLVPCNLLQQVLHCYAFFFSVSLEKRKLSKEDPQ